MSEGLHLDPADPAPPYEQLRRQVLVYVAGGTLREGERMPPVRQLAGDLGVAAGTVARAYRELEAAGVVRTRRGGGTTVAVGAAAVAAAATRPATTDAEKATATLRLAVVAARTAGLTPDAVRVTVEDALRG